MSKTAVLHVSPATVVVVKADGSYLVITRRIR
jgi:hypothetical protein